MIRPDDAEPEGAFADVLAKYAGRWVAVENNAVIDNDIDLSGLVGRLNGERASAEIFQVREDPTTPCFY
jgi:hypothetical protein